MTIQLRHIRLYAPQLLVALLACASATAAQDISRQHDHLMSLLSVDEVEHIASMSSGSSSNSKNQEMREKIRERLVHHIEVEGKFEQFNLLRGLAKTITLVWYKPDKRRLISGVYDYDKNESFCHKLGDDSLRKAREAVGARILRFYNSSTSVSGYGFGFAIPPNGIYIETDKSKIFVGITPFGFHLGEWESNKIDQACLFYCPALAFWLEEYRKEHSLNDFSDIYSKTLSGQDMFESTFPKNIPSCPCPESVRHPENAGRNTESGEKMSGDTDDSHCMNDEPPK